MVTASSKLKPVADTPPEAPAALPSFTLGKFTFAARAEPVPVEAAKRSNNANPLPFKDWFPVMKEGVGVPIPDAWWFAPKADGGRAMSPPMSKGIPVPMAEWTKRKLREAFANWRDTVDPKTGKANDDEGGPAYDKELFPVYYAVGQGKGGTEPVTEPHLVIWVKTVPGHTAKRKADMASSNAKRLETLAKKKVA